MVNNHTKETAERSTERRKPTFNAYKDGGSNNSRSILIGYQAEEHIYEIELRLIATTITTTTTTNTTNITTTTTTAIRTTAI
ncbi:unnamed protein product [Schistosoma margrebowiei]|uniref:Uncharacterized protein n=1 Tax=Schistosoma margrebowiei TaxID=48269 RepID=A0A183M2Q0_9TREM|nr:unnamed protein product [Schistosoma margrebowiei]